ncbi:hypothetical protein [Streptacidiphilus sp. EB103A]|uniref:hypothetical protein n=1 Tax=Streptacidiphilus sp. EB103A TaxID=3156275 RepID=UPI0035138826
MHPAPTDATSPLPDPPGPGRRHPMATGWRAMAGAPGSYEVTFHGERPDGVLVVFDDHLRCPRRGGAARAAHDRTIADWAERLKAAGFTEVRTGTCSASGTAPPRPRQPVTARVTRPGPLGSLNRAVAFTSYTGTCAFELRVGVTYACYQASDHTGRDIPLPAHISTEAAVVRAIADHYDLPGPLDIRFDPAPA